MAETEAITVAETTAGAGATDDSGRAVDLPVVELLTGRGFITGKSGSGKSNTASVVAENLLDNGFGLLIVDIDGEYYGLKEAYEILHVGADEECDIQVTVEHAEKIASLALEQNVPIILDVSSFLDQDEAEQLLTEVARHLFAKAKKQKQPFLLLVEEIHEWIPEKGSVGEVGQMLIKIGKRGRKHGLGIVGISQRPADVKKDYITQCDWLVWHRLTWNNDTKVVGRILDSEYADAVEDLDDGEAFMMTDWSEAVRRVKFHRKQTFDAGATPGLDDFERPELKSVSDDLVSELTEISEEKQRQEDRIADLREELDRKNSRIAELERELQDARDLSRMAEQFTEALVDHVEGYNPGRTEQERLRRGPARARGGGRTGDGSAGTGSPRSAGRTSAAADESPAPKSDGGTAADAGSHSTAGSDGGEEPTPSDDTAADTGTANGEDDGDDEETSRADRTSGGGFGDAFGAFADDEPTLAGGSDESGDSNATVPAASERGTNGNAHRSAVGRGNSLSVDVAGFEGTAEPRRAAAVDADDTDEETLDRVLIDCLTEIKEMDEVTRRMLAFYVEHGPDTPLNAHFSAGGSDDRTGAYAHNRDLRVGGFVEHVGRGRYDARLADLLRDAADRTLDPARVQGAVQRLERAITEP